MVGERLRRRAGAALAAIDDQEIRRHVQAAAIDRVAQVVDEAPPADRGLDADRLAGQIADVRDLVEQFIDIGDVVMPVRADRVLAHRNAAHLGDQRRDLGAGQHAALARLGAL